MQPAARHLASECLAGDPDQIRVRFDGHNLVAVGEKSCSVLAGVHADVEDEVVAAAGQRLPGRAFGTV